MHYGGLGGKDASFSKNVTKKKTGALNEENIISINYQS